MHIFLSNFHQGIKYIAKIASHQEYLRREVNFTDKKYLSVTSLCTDYLNLDKSSGSGRKIREQILFRQNAFFVKVLTLFQRNALKGQ